MWDWLVCVGSVVTRFLYHLGAALLALGLRDKSLDRLADDLSYIKTAPLTGRAARSPLASCYLLLWNNSFNCDVGIMSSTPASSVAVG